MNDSHPLRPNRRFLTILMLSIAFGSALSGVCYAASATPLDTIEPIFVPKNTAASIVADDGYAANGEYGCDDNWSEFHSTNWTYPVGVWSTNNWVNQLAIDKHGGLNGYTRTNVYGQVITKLCITDEPLSNPHSVHVLY